MTLPGGMCCLQKVEYSQAARRHVSTLLPLRMAGTLALRREQLDDSDMRPSLREMEPEEHPKCDDTAGHRSITKGYWAQRNSVAARDGMLELH